MALLVVGCPRCGAGNMTFDVLVTIPAGMKYRWAKVFEAFSKCRNCQRSTVFIIVQRRPGDEDFLAKNSPTKFETSLNDHFEINGFISLRDKAGLTAPAHVPDDVAKVFNEGATAQAVEIWNAAGTMFRLCIDLATAPLLPEQDVEGLNIRTRRDLGLRLPWLFQNAKLPRDLETLSHCVREDGNDAAHRGNLERADADDLADFTVALLERLYTEPRRIELAQQRRDERREPKEKAKED